MNKRVFKIRLIAWILCCVCLVTMIPTSAMAFETERLQTTETVESTETISGVTETQISAETTEITIEETETANTTEEDDVETVVLETEMLETELTTEEAETETSETTETEEVTTETEAIQETSEAETETTEENVETETSETETTEVADEAISLYEELMLADTCEQMYKLLQAEENQDAVLMLTVDELTSLQTRANAMEDDGWKEDVLEVLDMLIAIANGEGDGDTPTTFATATIKNKLENVIVQYASYKKGSKNPEWIWSEVFKTGDTLELKYNTTSGDKEEYYVFFVKPIDNYLLKTFTITNQNGTSNYDLYSIDIKDADWEKVNIHVYPDIKNLIATAKGEGYAYVGFNGYRGSAVNGNTGDVTLTQNFKAVQPSLEVSATANPSKDIKPGEKVEFTINVKPQLIDTNDKVTKLTVTLLEINDTKYENVTLTENADGTYTAVVNYVATDEDWRAGKIELTVKAEVNYEYVLPVKDRENDTSNITTTSVIKNSGTAECLFATDYGVSYVLQYDKPENITVPDTIPMQPKDEKRYYEGEIVTVKDYNRASIDDSKNGGTWEFSGWEYAGKKDYTEGNKINMPEGGLELKGTWKFVPYPNLTIKKTVSGNMQDPEKEFAFTIIADKDMTYSTVTEDGTVTKVTVKEIKINLKKDQEVTISVPRGATVTVSEDASGYTYSIGKDTTIVIDEEFENGIKFTMPNEDSTVVFNNDKSITLDTGIVLDTLPYIVILILVAGGAVLLFKKRQDREDD